MLVAWFSSKLSYCYTWAQPRFTLGVKVLKRVDIWATSWQNQLKGMCVQRRLGPTWASDQSDQSLCCPPEETLGLQLPIERTVKTLIRLSGCPGWSESSLGTHTILLVFHEAAHFSVLSWVHYFVITFACIGFFTWDTCSATYMYLNALLLKHWTLWCLSHRQPGKAQPSLHNRSVSAEPSLFAHMKYGSRWRVWPIIRHLAPLDGCACAFEEWV